MRAGVILYNPQSKQILLIHRWKNGEEYFVIPGGGAESGETAVQIAQREIREELGWSLSEKQLQPAFTFRNGQRLGSPSQSCPEYLSTRMARHRSNLRPELTASRT